MPNPIKLEFSEKYDDKHAQSYLLKHQDNLARRLSTNATSNWRVVRWSPLASLAWCWTCRVGPGVSGRYWRKSLVA